MGVLVAQIEFREGITNAWNNVAEFVPKLAAAIAIFVVGWIVARAIRNVTIRVLRRVHFDTLVDRSGLGGAIAQAGYPDSGILLARLIYYAILLLVLTLAIDVFGPSAVQDALNSIISFLPKVFVAIVIVFIAGAIANVVRDLVQAGLATVSYGRTVAQLAAAGVWIIGIFAALDQIDVAADVVETLFRIFFGSLGAILVIKFGVGGIWAARDRFWPAVYDRLSEEQTAQATTTQPPPAAQPPSPPPTSP